MIKPLIQKFPVTQKMKLFFPDRDAFEIIKYPEPPEERKVIYFRKCRDLEKWLKAKEKYEEKSRKVKMYFK